MLLENFHWIRPEWFLMLIPLLGLIYLLQRNHGQQENWHKSVDAHLLPHLLISTKNQRRSWPVVLLALGWFITVLILAGPTWSKLPQALYKKQEARVLVLDLSASMAANDVSPQRYVRARYKVLDILKHLKEGQVGMVVFTSEPYIVSPLTEDAATLASLVPSLAPDIMPSRGNAISQSLNMAAQLIEQAGNHEGQIILLTDGPVTSKDIKTAQHLKTLGIQTSVLAVGTEHGAPVPSLSGQGYHHDEQGAIQISQLPTKELKKLVHAGSGQLTFLSHDDSDINQLLSNFSTQSNPKTKENEIQSTALWQDQGHWFVLLLLPICLLVFRKGWLREIIKI